MEHASDPHLASTRGSAGSIWDRPGLTPREQRVLDACLLALLLLFTAGWVYSTIVAIREGGRPNAARQIGSGSPLSATARNNATFAMDALIQRLVDWEEVRGESGELRVIFRGQGDTAALALPDAVPEDLAVRYRRRAGVGRSTSAAATRRTETAPRGPGIWNLLLRIGQVVREVPELSVISLVPASAAEGGRIGAYRLGEWPRREGEYAPPTGFVQVTPENMDTYVSTHFQLRDFLTKGQEGVWPKYEVVSTRLLDKLELTIQELERRGHPVDDVFVISGFRTPWYNRAGGNTQGRAALSRHMYGDASDIAIDNDGDGCMDDLTGDGEATIADARVVAEAAEQVERDHPDLIGGIGIYAPVAGSHCGFVHIDTRGYRARW